MKIEPWEIGAATVGVAAAAFVARSRVKFVAARVALARAARRHGGVKTGAGRLLVGSVVPWIVTCLSIERDGRVVEAYPGSLGLLRDDPPYTWWSVSTAATIPDYATLSIHRREHVQKWDGVDWEPRVVSESESFDARFWAQLYSPSPGRRDVASAMIRDLTVQSHVEALLAGGDDAIRLGFHISLTRRRVGMAFEDVLAQMERVAALASAIEHVFAPPAPYR